ncbi:hypothetical protein ACH5RR_035800 [Cinchona calisaya]|uniref:Retrovirus-related Pol polyprotein from transposon TNT 1-94-like beta-barrel domain-containing protein n=1 Tax=Cinchona calisaya TaxID=153742 RepID=A0ABD2Y6T5_9GENT
MSTNQGGAGQNQSADGQDRRHQRSKPAESNAATSSQNVNEPYEDWDVQVSFAVEECAFWCTTGQKDELALTTINTNHINYNVDWIIDPSCSNHMTGDKRKLTNLTEYKRGRMVVTTDNSKLPITHTSNATILLRYNSHQVELQHVFHVPGMKKNLLSVSKLTASGNFVLFRPDEVKVYQNKKITGHVSYHKLKIMMMKSMLKGLPQLDVGDDIVCTGCQSPLEQVRQEGLSMYIRRL